MAYDKFKANVMAKAIQKERDRVAVFVQDCNREYEGDVKGLGDSVTIKGAGQVTMTNVTDGTQSPFSDPEFIEGTNAIMTIKHMSTFNFAVTDVDAEQGAGGALAVYQEQASNKIANAQDQLIAGLVTDPLAVHSSAEIKIEDTSVLGALDTALQTLWENDVPQTEKVTAYVSPRFYMILKQKYQALDTNNSEMLKRGAVAMYGSMDIKLSNNVATFSSGAKDYIMVKTQQAIAFANPLTKIEAKRANNYIADEIRGVSLYDAKLIKPKEMFVIDAKYA